MAESAPLSTIDPLSGADQSSLVGVIDLGSNSVRLVVYNGLRRALTVLFNEKALCGLGRGLQTTGRLNQEGCGMALTNLARYVQISKAMGVRHLAILATAAVRDARDGPAFAAIVEKVSGVPVHILSGAMESHYSALGVVSGAPGANGVMGDLGGVSLELVTLHHGTLGDHEVTLPLGPLRLMSIEGGRQQQIEYIENELAPLEWLDAGTGHELHPVGGSWRAIAKAHIEHVRHSLRVTQGYTVDGQELGDFAEMISRQSRSSLERTSGVPRRRADTLPLAALVIERLVRKIKPATVIFSALGLREGLMFHSLSEADRQLDPLLEICEMQAQQMDRLKQGKALVDWTAPLYPNEKPADKRLRIAACLLADLAWSDHPEYRAQHAFERALHMSCTAIDHPGRAFIALAVYASHRGQISDPVVESARALADPELSERARLLGLTMRLGRTMTGGASDLLPLAPLRLIEDAIELTLTGSASALESEATDRRLCDLALAMNRQPRLVLDGPGGNPIIRTPIISN